MSRQQEWLYEIKPKGKFVDLNLKEIWRYRDLFVLFVKRDIVTVYKQTILGPLWFLIQPLLTAVVLTLIFSNLANLDYGTTPPFLFNLASVILWNYFKKCLSISSTTFTANASLFGKVYFPRIIVPLSKATSGLLELLIQMCILVFFYVFYKYNGSILKPGVEVLLFPFLLIIIILLGVGTGLVLSALTTKYRDLTNLVTFGLSLLMYLSAVPFTIQEAQIKLGSYSWVIDYNPLAHIIDSFRNAVLGTGQIDYSALGYATVVALIASFFGLVIFNRTEKTFIDTV
ncbi:ABC transporter permease [Nonlabens sp.]|uniref:ABC transporter permease n=1 Tax=Nonlabens sp. TaxID=1888209 RepID=UPI003F69B6A6